MLMAIPKFMSIVPNFPFNYRKIDNWLPARSSSISNHTLDRSPLNPPIDFLLTQNKSKILPRTFKAVYDVHPCPAHHCPLTSSSTTYSASFCSCFPGGPWAGQKLVSLRSFTLMLLKIFTQLTPSFQVTAQRSIPWLLYLTSTSCHSLTAYSDLSFLLTLSIT